MRAGFSERIIYCAAHMFENSAGRSFDIRNHFVYNRFVAGFCQVIVNRIDNPEMIVSVFCRITSAVKEEAVISVTVFVHVFSQKDDLLTY